MALCFCAQAADLVRVSHFELPEAPIDSTMTPCFCAQAADLLLVFHFGVPGSTHEQGVTRRWIPHTLCFCAQAVELVRVSHLAAS